MSGIHMVKIKEAPKIQLIYEIHTAIEKLRVLSSDA